MSERDHEGYPIKYCDYCDHVGRAHTFMNNETICKKCLGKLPTDPRECRKQIVEQAAKIKELERKLEGVVELANYRTESITKLQSTISAQQNICSNLRKQIQSEAIENEALNAENEKLKELMSGLVHWNNQGHIDQSFWDAAAQLTDPTMG